MSLEAGREGDRVSYEDMANPRRHGIIVEVTDNPWSTFRVRWDEGDEAWTDGRQLGWRIDTDDAAADVKRAWDEGYRAGLADAQPVPKV